MASTKICAIALFIAIGVSGFPGFSSPAVPPAKNEQIRISGKIVVPGTPDEKYCDATITIGTRFIEILCQKKIFRPFNHFDSPRSNSLKIKISDTREIYLRKNSFYILTGASFFQEYRNLFHPFFCTKRLFHLTPEKRQVFALVFLLSNPADIGDREKRFIDKINKKLRRTSHPPCGWS